MIGCGFTVVADCLSPKPEIGFLITRLGLALAEAVARPIGLSSGGKEETDIWRDAEIGLLCTEKLQ